MAYSLSRSLFVMKFKLILFFTAFSCYAFAQTPTLDTKMPAIVPPSPEIAELSRYSDVKSSMFTGAANVNIPLYEFETGSIKTQVSLAYSNNGLKVSDIPSRVGMGWNLIAGGVISRTVHDEPDEKGDKLAPINFATETNPSVYLGYLRAATQYEYDTERDIYSINAPGISGKFYFDDQNVPRLVSHSNIKVSYVGSPNDEIYEFVVTDGNGIKYYFGENNTVEKTRETNLSGKKPKYEIQKTGWFLTHVLSPEGFSVTYSYNPIYFKTNQGPSQFVTLQVDGYVNSPCDICEPSFGSVQYTKIDYDSQYLRSISTSNAQSIFFQYEQRPDVSGDTRLIGLTSVTGNKSYSFRYLDVDVPAYELNQRFYLLDIKTIPSDAQTDAVKHSFEYDGPDSFPEQTSLSQDYFGYNNGARNTNYFPNVFHAYYRRSSEGGDRRPNYNGTKVGSLKKVIYPTGGSEEFFYELHTVSRNVRDTVWQTFHEVGLGSGLATWVDNSFYFSPVQSQVISGSLKISERPNVNPGDPYYNPIDGTHFVVRDFEIWDRTNNVRLFYKQEYSTTVTTTFSFSTIASANYEIKYRVCGFTPQAVVDFKYDPVVTESLQNIPVGGLRVSRIKSYDPVTAKEKNKYFTYASLADVTKSSGYGSNAVANSEFDTKGGWCAQHGGGTINLAFVPCHEMIGLHGSPVPKPEEFAGSPIAYSYVIESDSPDFVNGGIEHCFYAQTTSITVLPVLNTTPVNAIRSVEPNLEGVERSTTVFKKTSASLKKVSEIHQTYYIAILTSPTISYTAKKYWDFTQLGDNTPLYSLQDKIAGFVVNGYWYRSGAVHQLKTETVRYDQNGENPISDWTTFEYNADYTLQTKITSSKSEGYTQETSLKYPVDYTVTPYPAMVARNMLNPVVEQTVNKKSGTTTIPLSTIKVDYKDWSKPGYSNFKPEFVKQQTGNGPVENKVRFYSYDTSGNPTEVSKENGTYIAYIYDNFNLSSSYEFLPIAEVTNSTISNAAYTGFEGQRNGGWSYGWTKATDANTPVGSYCYDLAAGSITKSGLSAVEKYIVSYWSKNASAYTVTGTITGYPVKAKTKNGWSLFVHQVTGVTEITISGAGTNLIDEVRLHPLDAQMKTFAYNILGDVVASTDAKNVVTFFDYDGLQRLKNIKDQDGNILKNYNYRYLNIRNIAIFGTYKKQCANGLGTYVTYTVPEGKYTATTQQEADALAQADLAANGQAYANNNGVCELPFVKITLSGTTVNGSGQSMNTYEIKSFADVACTIPYTVPAPLTILYKKTTTTYTNGTPATSETDLSTTITTGTNVSTLMIMGNSCNTGGQNLVAGDSQNQQSSANGATTASQITTGGATTNGTTPPPGGGTTCERSYLTLRPDTGYNVDPGGGGIID